ncbi:hypothetical protein D9M72_352650 [compost metagenome]
MRIRGEEDDEFPVAGKVVLELRGEQRAGGERRAVDGPVALRPEKQPLAVHAQVHVGGGVDHNPLPVAQHGRALVEEADPVHREGPLVPRSGVMGHQGHHVVFGDVEDPLGRRKRPAAGQLHGGARVGRGGLRHAFRGGGHQQRVPVQPGSIALRCGQVEPTRRGVHERPALDVELPVAVGVPAVGGERQQSQPVRFAGSRTEEVGAVENPLLAFGSRQRVDVQEDVPCGLTGFVALPGRPAPQPLGVLPVTPEVVVPVAVLAHHGDLVR